MNVASATIVRRRDNRGSLQWQLHQVFSQSPRPVPTGEGYCQVCGAFVPHLGDKFCDQHQPKGANVANPQETNPISVTVPNRASSTATVPLNQPIDVSRPVNAPLPMSPTPITPARRK